MRIRVGIAILVLPVGVVAFMLPPPGDESADPFSASKNGINAERYLDLLVTGTSKLIRGNETHPVDSNQDPGFVQMATADKETWEFQPRPVRDVTYLRTSRDQALRLKRQLRSAASLSPPSRVT